MSVENRKRCRSREDAANRCAVDSLHARFPGSGHFPQRDGILHRHDRDKVSSVSLNYELANSSDHRLRKAARRIALDEASAAHVESEHLRRDQPRQRVERDAHDRAEHGNVTEPAAEDVAQTLRL